MEVKIIDATENPIDTISLAAGTSYNKDNSSLKRVQSCVKLGHWSVIEFANIYFKVEGISRACANQLVRHRLASYVQESERYVKIDISNDDWYVVPPSIEDSNCSHIYREHHKYAAINYKNMLDSGIKPEDARFLLPQSAKTKISVQMNCREFFNFLNLRLDSHAQWEIRELARSMKDAVASYNEQWEQIIEMYDGFNK